MKIIDIYNFLDSIAPFSLAADWDNSGFLIKSEKDEFEGGLICLDITDKIIDECIEKKYNLLISHHPIIFNGLKSISHQMLVYKLIKHDINVISAHTNLDVADEGVNFALSKALGLKNTYNTLPFGVIGELDIPTEPRKLAEKVKTALNCESLSYVSGNKKIKTVAVCGGAGASMTSDIIKLGIDAFVTSEVKHNIWLEAKHAGLTLIDAGHFFTENLVCDILLEKLTTHFKTNRFEIATNNKCIVSTVITS